MVENKSTTFTDTEVNNCFSIYHTSWITSGPKSNFICDNIPTKAILFFFGCSEVNTTWLITSELANQRARKVLFTCVVYTKRYYDPLLSGVPFPCLYILVASHPYRSSRSFSNFFTQSETTRARKIATQSKRAACFVKVTEYPSFRPRRYKWDWAHAQGLEK